MGGLSTAFGRDWRLKVSHAAVHDHAPTTTLSTEAWVRFPSEQHWCVLSHSVAGRGNCRL